jgi:hypothetical protein
MIDAVPEAVADLAKAGDLVITLGAGSIGAVGERILEAIRSRPAPTTSVGRGRPEPAGNGERR